MRTAEHSRAAPAGLHYSTVTADEQRESIGNVVQLFGRLTSGEHSGEHRAKGGTP
jgi:hypothetical protein